jgi:hypothetical protein
MASVVFVVDLYIRPGGAVMAEHVHPVRSCTIPRTAVLTNCASASLSILRVIGERSLEQIHIDGRTR